MLQNLRSASVHYRYAKPDLRRTASGRVEGSTLITIAPKALRGPTGTRHIRLDAILILFERLPLMLDIGIFDFSPLPSAWISRMRFFMEGHGYVSILIITLDKRLTFYFFWIFIVRSHINKGIGHSFSWSAWRHSLRMDHTYLGIIRRSAVYFNHVLHFK